MEKLLGKAAVAPGTSLSVDDSGDPSETMSPASSDEVRPTASEGAAADSQQVPQFTREDIHAARREEKDKLYPEIDRLKQEVNELRRFREDQAAQEAARQAELEAAAKREAEEAMDVRQLLLEKDREWSARLEAERQERERAFAILEQERAYAAVQTYRTRRIEESRDDILPELIDFVTGDTKEAVEESIRVLVERSAMIVDNARGASQTVRRESPGSRVTSPPMADPLENFSGQRQLSPQEISGMSMDEYVKYRDSLLGNGAGRGSGMFQ